MNRFNVVVILIFFANMFVHAVEVIELPDEELAKESVVPVYSKMESVKNRQIVTDGKFDFGFFYSYAMTEPIFSMSRLGVNTFYHLNEYHALGVSYKAQMSGLSSYADQLYKQYLLDFNRAPMPESTFMVEYNLKAYYGKMSLSKNTVSNLSLYCSAGAGMVKYVHKSYPAVMIGLGQKFYFNKNWALRFDLDVLMHNAPIPFLEGKLKGSSVPSYSEFSERMNINTTLDAGISYLF